MGTEFWPFTQATAVDVIKYRDLCLLRSPPDPEDGGIRIFRNAGEFRAKSVIWQWNVQQFHCETYKYRIIQGDSVGKVKFSEVTIGYLEKQKFT